MNILDFSKLWSNKKKTPPLPIVPPFFHIYDQRGKLEACLLGTYHNLEVLQDIMRQAGILPVGNLLERCDPGKPLLNPDTPAFKCASGSWALIDEIFGDKPTASIDGDPEPYPDDDKLQTRRFQEWKFRTIHRQSAIERGKKSSERIMSNNGAHPSPIKRYFLGMENLFEFEMLNETRPYFSLETKADRAWAGHMAVAVSSLNAGGYIPEKFGPKKFAKLFLGCRDPESYSQKADLSLAVRLTALFRDQQMTKTLLQSILPLRYPTDGPAFVMVGALHMPGLVEMIRASGRRVEAVHTTI